MYMPANENILSICKITFFERYKLLLLPIILLGFYTQSSAQKYLLRVEYVDSISTILRPAIRDNFSNRSECMQYVQTLPDQLRKKGFLGVSLDSMRFGADTAFLRLYLGSIYLWGGLRVNPKDENLLEVIGYRNKYFRKMPFDFSKIRLLQEKIVGYLENHGHPFASVKLDSFDVSKDSLNAALLISRGPLYKIDSIRVFGEVKLGNQFLQRYLDLPNGVYFKKQRLLDVDKKLKQLPYLIVQQPSDLNYLGSGALLNVYLKAKKSSQINGLIGFLPSSESAGSDKLLITGDLNLNLKNSFGLGETIAFMFQQIQIQSPRLKLSYQQPYLFGSAFGTELIFEGFKKDSSFLNIQYQIGAAYAFGGNRNGKVFFQQFITTLDYIDTFLIKRNNRLPEQIDQTTSSIGVDYEWWNTDYRFNPRKGVDIKFQALTGLRQIRKNNTISSLRNNQSATKNYSYLYDSVELNAYTLRLRGSVAKYFKTGKQTVLKTAFHGAWVQSPSLFRNELFQLGGFQTLRGFDDESFFASAYGVITAEYRVLTGQNSYLYAFWDGGWVRNDSRFANTANLLWGLGIGATMDTKAGIFNVAFALGKREELPMNFRQLKIHFGYLNFF
jgi:outer membrane protein assembly factor BamA